MDLKQRTTIRKYSDKNVSDELIYELMESACRASNTGNMQTYSIVVTRDENKKYELAPCHFNQPMVTCAPVIITFCVDFNRFSQWCTQRDAQPGFENFQSFMGATIDTMLMAQTFCTSAEANGLGLCYLGTTTYNAQQIIDVLNLPKLVVPIATISLGYPAEKPKKQDRLPLSAIIHNETYKPYSKEDINQIYSEKENLTESHQFITENSKTSLAQVFTDVRYPKERNELYSCEFIQVLKNQGFL